jgi:hypothetical protein
MKIDVQGGEMGVLLGAQNTIQNCRPVLVIERNKHNESEVNIYLAGLGYKKVDGTAAQKAGVALGVNDGDNVFMFRAA